MKIWLPIFLLSLLIYSCSSNDKVNIPADILPPDTMVQVLTDIHLTQASHQMAIPIDTSDTTALITFNYVWKKHHITDSMYKKNLAFYSIHTRLLDSIYEKVLGNLSRQKAELLGKKIK